MIFWIAIVALCTAVAVLLSFAAVRGRGRDASVSAYDIKVYRDQLGEVERDAERGVIAPEDAERTRTEISRRILAADRAGQGAPAADQTPRSLTLALLAGIGILFAGSVALYARIGAPLYPDMPIAQRIMDAHAYRENRPRQGAAVAAARAAGRVPVPGEVDPSYAELMERLRASVADRPGDLRGLVLLARNEAELGNFDAAAAAQYKLVEVKGDTATADDLARLAEILIVCAGGYVSPEAETQLARALQRDENHGLARYYTGLMYAQTGRPDIAFGTWKALLEEGGDTTWNAAIRSEIGELAVMAGVRYSPPTSPAIRGPELTDIEAAADMSAEDRDTMIRGMVGRLSDRLANEGGSADEWAQLIAALGVLGETERARAIWTEAEGVFEGREAELAALRAAASGAGVVE